VHLGDDPVGPGAGAGPKELRAPTAGHAAYYLDAAVAARTVSGRLENNIQLNGSILIFNVDDYLYYIMMFVRIVLSHKNIESFRLGRNTKVRK